jgi:hypothetical protein
MPKRGIYFLANDRLFDQVLAFLNSLRAHEPDIPVCLIPYDDQTRRIRALQSSHGFVVLDDPALLAWCDETSLRFHPRVRGHYRKLAAWRGIFDEFIYIDVDTVLLRPVTPFFALLEQHDVVTAFSHDPGSRQFVWKNPELARRGLSEREIEYAANTGFILSRRDLLRPETLDEMVRQAALLAGAMELECVEQPLLNYLFVKSTARFTSIHHLNALGAAPKFPHECWPGDRGWVLDPPAHCSYRGEPAEIFLVHWSGLMVPTPREKRLYSLLSYFGLRAPAQRLIIRQARIWRYYRDLRRSGYVRWLYRLLP